MQRSRAAPGNVPQCIVRRQRTCSNSKAANTMNRLGGRSMLLNGTSITTARLLNNGRIETNGKLDGLCAERWPHPPHNLRLLSAVVLEAVPSPPLDIDHLSTITAARSKPPTQSTSRHEDPRCLLRCTTPRAAAPQTTAERSLQPIPVTRATNHQAQRKRVSTEQLSLSLALSACSHSSIWKAWYIARSSCSIRVYKSASISRKCHCHPSRLSNRHSRSSTRGRAYVPE